MRFWRRIHPPPGHLAPLEEFIATHEDTHQALEERLDAVNNRLEMLDTKVDVIEHGGRG